MMGLESDITEEFFNVGSGSETTVTELAELMMDIMDKKVDIVYKDDDSQKVKNRKSSTNKINQLLNFVPKVKVRNGLVQYIESKNDS
jgi:UDP-glucose 4-epimerase